MKTKKYFGITVGIILLAFLAGCAGTPVREAVKVDLKVPVGNIEGNQFTGLRYPFKVSAPSGWKVSMEYPQLMIDVGYHKEGLEESEVFLFNPQTRSNGSVPQKNDYYLTVGLGVRF